MVYPTLQLMLKHTLLAGVPFVVACVLVTWSTDPSDVRDVGGSSVITFTAYNWRPQQTQRLENWNTRG